MSSPPHASASTNCFMLSHALSHMPSGIRAPSLMNVMPSRMPQACSIGFSYSSIRSAWRTMRITVILHFFMSYIVSCRRPQVKRFFCCRGRFRYADLLAFNKNTAQKFSNTHPAVNLLT